MAGDMVFRIGRAVAPAVCMAVLFLAGCKCTEPGVNTAVAVTV